MKMHKWIWLLLPGVPLFGQTAPTSENEPPPIVEVIFSVFPLENGNWEGIHFAPEGTPDKGIQEITFNRSERSIKYEYKGPLPLIFFRTEPDDNGNILYRPVGRLDAEPEPAKQEYILFFEPADEQGSHRISKMNAEEQSFPEHSIVFFNTMDVSFIGVLAENRMVIPPGTSPPLDVSGLLDTDVPIALAIRHNEGLHLVARNSIRFARERKTLMILRPPRREGSLRIRTQRLTEFTGELAADEPAPPEETEEE